MIVYLGPEMKITNKKLRKLIESFLTETDSESIFIEVSKNSSSTPETNIIKALVEFLKDNAKVKKSGIAMSSSDLSFNVEVNAEARGKVRVKSSIGPRIKRIFKIDDLSLKRLFSSLIDDKNYEIEMIVNVAAGPIGK